jgi:hypothetical protein
VHKPGKFCERREFEDLQAMGFAQAPGSHHNRGGRDGALPGTQDFARAGSGTGSGSGWRAFPFGHVSDSIVGGA